MARKQSTTPKLKAYQQSDDRPWSAERLIATPDDLHPQEQQSEREPRRLHFSGGRARPVLDKVSGGWTLDVPDGVRMGLEAAGGENAIVKNKRPRYRMATAAYRPAGTSLRYHPPVLGRFPERIVRRRNGRRMQQHTIFADDDREIFNPRDDYPWCCVGRILIWNRPDANFWDPADDVGTGALIAPNIVLTSSHMIPDGLKRFKAIFLPGLFDSKTSLDEYSYVSTWRRYKPYDQGSDIAILRLWTPIGARLGWFGVRTYDDDWEDLNVWSRVGYASIPLKGTTGTKPNRALNFPIIDDDDSYGVELEYRSDASPGDSGGPVFAWWNDGPYIVGVHSGGEVEFDLGAWGSFFASHNNVAAGGPALADLVSWGLEHWS